MRTIHVAATIEDAVNLSRTLADLATAEESMSPADCSSAIEYATVARGGRAQDLNFF